MNSTDPWAKRLASWTPRQPSPELEERLFGAIRTPTPNCGTLQPSLLTRWVGWGIPSLGTAFLVASLWIHPVTSMSVLSGGQDTQLAVLSSSSAQSAQNALPLLTFSWTNSTQPAATNGSLKGWN